MIVEDTEQSIIKRWSKISIQRGPVKDMLTLFFLTKETDKVSYQEC